jgi:error-prone DNA polymerase
MLVVVQMKSYAELHCLSNFSFLRGASHPEELVIRAQELGYQALAITDECSVAGVVRAYSAIQEHQLSLKLIIGTELNLSCGQKVIILAPCRKAYAEMCRVITVGRRRCEKGSYALARDDLESLASCLLLWLPSHEEEQDWAFSEWLMHHFNDRAWLLYERLMVPYEVSGGYDLDRYTARLSQRARLPICAAGNVHMHVAERQPLQDILTAIRLNTTVQSAGHALFSNAERAMRSVKKLAAVYPQAWLDETLNVAARCELDLGTLRYEYPRELVPANMSPQRHLKALVEEGGKRRFPNGVSLQIQRTIRRELALIAEQGYEYFFLTTHDIVQFAKRQGILYQGRGSAANSVVCYCLEITSVDPRQINVLFERFISKERNEPPDIDVDFEHQRREEVFQYIYQKYGRERAALAATVIRFKFKSALRCVGKALGLNESTLDYYIKNINRRDRELAWQSQLNELGLDPNSALGGHLIRLTHEIIGFPRHLSQHVGGFVISAGPLSELVPIENAAMADRTVIQWDKNDLESLGLLKVDVLALGMLSAIRRSFEMIEHLYGRSLCIADITREGDDPEVYAQLQRADSVGVFQVESRAQMSMLPRLKPACYYDLVIQIAIVRPGPIQGDMVHPYLRRREGKEAVEYPSPEVKAVLERTLGVPIFQEQVIKLAMVAAGFSGGEADQLRRAMASWNKSGQLVKFQHKLISGMESRGYERDFAERVFQQILGFGEYGFPESHSASFAVLAYVSSWLKHYYPYAFYCGLLNSLPMGFYTPSQLLQDASRHGLSIDAICINHSDYDHRIDCDHGIDIAPQDGAESLRLGFRLVRGLSRKGIERLLAGRPLKGFVSMEQVQRIGLDRRDLEALASANAFACLSGNRYQARWDILNDSYRLPLFDSAVPKESSANENKVAEISITENSVDELSAHGVSMPPSRLSVTRLPSPNNWDDLQEDYAATGLSLAHHPIHILRNAGVLGRFTEAINLSGREHKSKVTVTGVVTGRQSPGTAGGVTFFTLEDHTGNINVVVWQATARAQKKAYLRSKILEVTGILEKEGDVIHVIAGRLTDKTHLMSELDARSRNFH